MAPATFVRQEPGLPEKLRSICGLQVAGVNSACAFRRADSSGIGQMPVLALTLQLCNVLFRGGTKAGIRPEPERNHTMAQYWYLRTADGTVEGPCTEDQLQRLAASGVITGQSLVSEDGASWHPANQIEGLFPTFASAGQSDVSSTRVDDRKSVPVAGKKSPVVCWVVVLAATLLTAGFLAVVANQPGRTIEPLVLVIFWVVLGLIGSLGALIGVWRHSALAYRFGLVFGPLGAGAVLLTALSAGKNLDNTLWLMVALIVALGILTPILWTQPGVKRYFGLCCPRCGGLSIGAESFGYKDRRCLACNTIFVADGRILVPGGMMPGLGAASTSGMMATSPWPGTTERPPLPAAPPTQPTAPPGMIPYGSAGFNPGVAHGPPGKARNTTWFLVVSTITLGFFLLHMGSKFALGIQHAHGVFAGGRRHEDIATGLVSCFIVSALLGLLIYWLVWVYNVHRELQQYTWYQYRISPGKALGFCFIPFFNLYWTVYMPYELSRTLFAYLGRRPGTDKSGLVLVYQILGIVPGACVLGLRSLFIGLTMRLIQNQLNELWRYRAAEIAPPQTAGGGTDSMAAGLQGSSAPVPIPPQSGQVLYPGPTISPQSSIPNDRVTRMLLPVGRSGLAIAAGYAGLFSLVIIPAPIALILSIVAIVDLKGHPEKHGWGRTIFGLIMGLIGTVILAVCLAATGFG